MVHHEPTASQIGNLKLNNFRALKSSEKADPFYPWVKRCFEFRWIGQKSAAQSTTWLYKRPIHAKK